MKPPLALIGPTASGKTEASVPIAQALGAEILCVDSMSIYRGLDAATAKPTPEQRAAVRHHLIDLVDVGEPFSVADYRRQASRAIGEIRSGGRLPLLVGGSGLYYRAVVDELTFPPMDPVTRRMLQAEADAIGPQPLYERLADLDPAAAGRIHSANGRRTIRALEVAAITGRRFSDFFVQWDRFDAGAVRAAGVHLPRQVLHHRIEERARDLVPLLLEETGRLLAGSGGSPILISAAIGYAEAARCLQGRMSREELEQAIVRQHKALARRQMAWFRRDPRIRWFEAGQGGAIDVIGPLIEYLGNAVPERGSDATMTAAGQAASGSSRAGRVAVEA